MRHLHLARLSSGALLVLVLGSVLMYAQSPSSRGPSTSRSPKDASPFDVSGYWVSIVSEDWRVRMFTPPKGDFSGIPLTDEGRKVAQAWDPAKDEAAGEQCKSYGAGAIMRVPGRFHIAWEDDSTLKIEADSGTQTRLLHFSGTPPQGAEPQFQGYSTAQWQRQLGPSGGDGGRPGPGGTLKVVTVNLRPGYLRKNGVPYSERTVVTEYYDLIREPDSEWLVVKTIVEDPLYLTRPFITSTNLRRQLDASGWKPSPCIAR
jgi:hypothetical protein